MIAPLLDFLEGIVKNIGIENVVKEAAQQKQMQRRPYCHLIPQRGTVTKDWTRAGKEVRDPAPEPGRVSHFIRKWRLENPVRVVFVAGKDCELYGLKFLSALPQGFLCNGQWVDVAVTAELPPLDESLLYDAGEIAYDVVFESGVYTPVELPLFRDATLRASVDKI